MTRSQETSVSGHTRISSQRSAHPGDLFCDDPKCPQCRCPPCPRCKGKGKLVALYPTGMATFTCPACGGCGSDDSSDEEQSHG